MIAAAVLEGWATARLGRRSVMVVALVLGRLCDTFGVDPDAVSRVVHLAHEASRDAPDLMRS